jgi:hypothetical protein
LPQLEEQVGPSPSDYGEPRDVRLQVEAAAVAAVWRYEVGGARSAVKRVLHELLAHHLPRGVRRDAEPLSDFDAGLQRVALGRPFVAHAAEVPRLMGENGECACALARIDLALEREPVEVKAALRRQVGKVPSDGGNPVGVLDGADVVAGFVAADRDRFRRDA